MSSLKMATHDESGLPGLEFDGELRVLAALPADVNRASYKMFAPWSAEMPVLPRQKWFETQEDDFFARVLNQKAQGSCTGHMGCTQFEIAWLRAGGNPVDFSACFPYGLVNGGRDAGGFVSDICEVLQNTGICTEAEVPPGMIFKRQFPAKAFEVAKNYRVEKVYRVTNFDEACTAVLMGWTLGSGVMVGGNYADLDSDGVAPLPRGGGGGHARCSYALRNIRGRWVLRTRNSWGKSYGMNGDCYEQEAMFGRPGSLDAFAVKVVRAEAMDNLPPVVKN